MIVPCPTRRMSDNGITREKETGPFFRKAGGRQQEAEGEDKQAAAAQEGEAEMMDNDPYLSDWENTVKAAREQENRELSIESRYPLPGEGEKMDKQDEAGIYMPVKQQIAIIKAYSQVSLFAKWDGPGKEEAAIEAKAALEGAFPWLVDDSEEYMAENC